MKMAKEMKTVSVSDLRIARTKGSIPTETPETIKDVVVSVDKLTAVVDELDKDLDSLDARIKVVEGKEPLNADAINDRLVALETALVALAVPVEAVKESKADKPKTE